jgi:hypothetical protein
MEKERFRGICSVASEGKLKWVDNLKTHQSGRVLSCASGKFEIESEGHRRKWNPDECEERTYGYQPVYGED